MTKILIISLVVVVFMVGFILVSSFVAGLIMKKRLKNLGIEETKTNGKGFKKSG